MTGYVGVRTLNNSCVSDVPVRGGIAYHGILSLSKTGRESFPRFGRGLPERAVEYAESHPQRHSVSLRSHR